MDEMQARVAAIRERIDKSARRVGRSADAVQLIAVSKTHPAELVRAAVAAGLDAFGENRVQEADAKIAELADLRDNTSWHLIGHLQRNKAKRAAVLFDMIQSVDSLELAETLSRHRLAAQGATQPLDILLQVNVSGEQSKEGFDLAAWQERPEALKAFLAAVEQIAVLPSIRIRGLMTIAPWEPDPELARPTFRAAQALRERLAQQISSIDWQQLSMGMTDDFEVAIEEGTTMVRIGRALFGSRV